MSQYAHQTIFHYEVMVLPNLSSYDSMLTVIKSKNKDMFRKLISNLPFSPSLIDEVALYSKRLKRESKVRGIGLAMVLVAVTIQLFGVLIVTPEPHKTAVISTTGVLGISTVTAERHQANNNISAIIHDQEITASTSKNAFSRHLPQVHSTFGLIASFSFVALAAFFYSRSRLMAKELDIVKADITSNGGL